MDRFPRTSRPVPVANAAGLRPLSRRRFLLGFAGVGLAACTGNGDNGAPTPAPSASPSPTFTPTLPATPAPSTTATPSPTPYVPAGPAGEPTGFPLDPATVLGAVVGDAGARTLAWGEGPAALPYSRDDQPSADPVRANRSGWNARVHVEYEGEPAVDWYIPIGTPIVATHDGVATLLVNTVSNPFDVYGVGREPYIGNPDRARAPIVPFPGPGGGQGVFVRVENAGFRTDYAHLDLAHTMPIVPSNAWLSGFSPSEALLAQFAPLRDFRTATAIARWDVRKGQVIGLSGDTGYSEGPHLHYTIRRAGAAHLLCPTTEPGFPDSGWLLKS